MKEVGELLSEKLHSQVQVVGQPMVGVESVAVGILVGAGARDEVESRYGISHFAEQMLFRGTEHLDARQLSERFDALGIDYDTSSGLEMTLLTAVLIGDRLPQAVDLLADVVRYASFPEEAVENVRSLLVQEIRQREDRPAQKVMDMLRQMFFAGSALGHDVLGTEATIERFSRDDLVSYWQDRYTANNITISVAGNFAWKPLVEQLRRVTADWPVGVGRLAGEVPSSRSGVTVYEKDTAQENIGFAFPSVAVADSRYYASQLLSQALGGGVNSRLFREVREKHGLAYAVQARADGLEKGGLFRVYVGTTPDKAHQSVDVIMGELRKLESGVINQDELRLAKTRLKSQLVMRSESTGARMMANLRSWWFEGALHPLEETRKRIDAVTVGEVGELIQSLGITRNLAIVALGPRSEQELFGNVLTRS